MKGRTGGEINGYCGLFGWVNDETFVDLERDVGGRGGVRHHALHLEELLTCNPAGNHCAAAKIIDLNIVPKVF